jgi:hypothetical protein
VEIRKVAGRRGSRKCYEADDHVEILISQAKSDIDLRKGNRSLYHTPWLLNGELESPEWTSLVPNKDYTLKHSFDRSLADGSNLLDEQNKPLLEAIQKSAILARNGVTTEGHMTPKRWNAGLLITINFASWVTMRRSRFQPELYGFAQVTLDDYNAFLDQFVSGGWTEALKCRERIISHFHSRIEYSESIESILESPENLDVKFVRKVCEWLTENNLYSMDGNKPACVSRTYLNKHVGLPGTAGNKELTAFLRQFEPHIQGDFLTASVKRGLPSHKSEILSSNSIIEGGVNQRSFIELISALNDLFKCQPHIPKIIPEISYGRKEALSKYKNILRRGSHTRLIPLTIGMHALNMASRWILEFGPAIVEATTFYAERFSEIPETGTDPCTKRNFIFHHAIENWSYYDHEKKRHCRLVDALNITSFSSRSYYVCSPSSTDFYRCLKSFIGACVVVIGLLKPMRDQEILNLPRDCLSSSPNIGSELTHEQLKAGLFGINPVITRAIPSLTARAIQLLQVMGSKLKVIYQDDAKHSDLLFYFPTRALKRPKTAQGLRDRINDCLDEFCNMIEIPLDKEGRRWYIRIHEMRKFFILVSHRHGGDKLSQLLRYQAGQKDKKHLADYIAPEASDDDYVRYESECIDDKIISLESGHLSPDNNDGLVALYKAACEALKVTSISSIPPDEAVRILSNMRTRGDYTVNTYSVTLDTFDGKIETIDFAIKYGEKSDAKFNKN